MRPAGAASVIPTSPPLRAAEVGITPALLQKQGSRQQDGRERMSLRAPNAPGPLRALAFAPARLRRPPVSRVISIVPSTRLACGMGQKAGPRRFRCRQSDGGGRYPAWAMESNQTHASKKDDLGPGRCAPRETKVRAGVP